MNYLNTSDHPLLLVVAAVVSLMGDWLLRGLLAAMVVRLASVRQPPLVRIASAGSGSAVVS